MTGEQILDKLNGAKSDHDLSERDELIIDALIYIIDRLDDDRFTKTLRNMMEGAKNNEKTTHRA